MLSTKKTQEDTFGFNIGITLFCPISASGAFRVNEITEIKTEKPLAKSKIKEKNLETIVILSHDISSSSLENTILGTSYDVPFEIIHEIDYPVVKDIVLVQPSLVLTNKQSILTQIPQQNYVMSLTPVLFVPYHISYTSQPHSEVFEEPYSHPVSIDYSDINLELPYQRPEVTYSSRPRLYYQSNTYLPVFYSLTTSINNFRLELEPIRVLEVLQNQTQKKDSFDYQKPEQKLLVTQAVSYLIVPKTQIQDVYNLKIKELIEIKNDYVLKPKLEIRVLEKTIVLDKEQVHAKPISLSLEAPQYVSNFIATIDYKPDTIVTMSNIALGTSEVITSSSQENYVVTITQVPNISTYSNMAGVELLFEQDANVLQNIKPKYVEESQYNIKVQKLDTMCAVLPVLESYSNPNSCLSVVSLENNNEFCAVTPELKDTDNNYCAVIPELETSKDNCAIIPGLTESRSIDSYVQGDKAELNICPVIPGLEEKFYVDADTKVRWFSVSKEIVSADMVTQEEYHIKVKGMVDFDRPFYESKSADYVTRGNSIVAVVDKILKQKGLVPVFEVPYEINSEAAINNGQIYLKDIMGVDNVAGNLMKSGIEVDYVVEITERKTFEKTLVSMQDLIKQEHLDSRKYAIDIIAQTRTVSQKTQKPFVEQIDEGYIAPTLRKLEYNPTITRSEPGSGRQGISEFEIKRGDVYDIVVMLQGHYDRKSENIQGAFSISPIEITQDDLLTNDMYLMEVKDSYGFEAHYMTKANSPEAIFDRKLREQGLKPVFVNYSTRRDEEGTLFKIGAKDNHHELALMGVQGASGELLNIYQNGKVSEIGVLIEKLDFASQNIKETYLDKLRVVMPALVE